MNDNAQRQMEYDFVVQPGADPGLIRFALQSSVVKTNRNSAPRIDRRGDLLIGTGNGELRFHKPAVYQATTDDALLRKDEPRDPGARRFVKGTYLLKGDRVTFELRAYYKAIFTKSSENRQPVAI
jgi:hypothetical protein